MRHPSSADCRKVARRLESIQDHCELIMSQSYIRCNFNYDNYDKTGDYREFLPITECGTVACHAGAYYAAKFGRHDFRKVAGASYSRGAVEMSRDLGFERVRLLTEWAKDNPEIWGGTDGAKMFISDIAFKPYGNSDIHWRVTLADVAEWWECVADRLEIMEG